MSTPFEPESDLDAPGAAGSSKAGVHSCDELMVKAPESPDEVLDKRGCYVERSPNDADSAETGFNEAREPEQRGASPYSGDSTHVLWM